jgi:hypothetical protein
MPHFSGYFLEVIRRKRSKVGCKRRAKPRMASSGTPDGGEGWQPRSSGPQHGEQTMHTSRPSSAPEVPHATNLRTAPIVPLMSRFSLGWSVVAAFTAGALTFYTVRSCPCLFIYVFISNNKTNHIISIILIIIEYWNLK